MSCSKYICTKCITATFLFLALLLQSHNLSVITVDRRLTRILLSPSGKIKTPETIPLIVTIYYKCETFINQTHASKIITA